MARPAPVVPVRRIAVVDDSAVVRQSLSVLMATHGFVVDTFPGSAELLASVWLADFDCFVIDLKLEGLDGAGLLAILRSKGFAQPAVLITGWNVHSLEDVAVQSGFAACVRKPMLETSVIDEIKRLLGA